MNAIFNFIIKFKSNTFLDFINDKSNYKNNKISLAEQNEYKDKINKLEKCVKELELKINERNKMITTLKTNYENLNKKVQELEDEIQLFKSYNHFSEGEKLIQIQFISCDQEIKCYMVIKNTEKFSNIEISLYQKYPKYLNSQNFFLVNGKIVNKSITIEQNKIKNNDVIIVQKNKL